MKTKEEVIEFLNNRNGTLNRSELGMVVKFAKENVLEDFFYIINNLRAGVYYKVILPSFSLEIKKEIFNGRIDEVIDHCKKMGEESFTPIDLDKIRSRFS